MDIRFSKYPAHYVFLIIFFIALVNGFYLHYIYQESIFVAWAYDVSQFVVLPFTLFYILHRKYNISPGDYGVIIPGNKFLLNLLIYDAIFYAVILNVLYFATYEFVDMYVPDKYYPGYVSLIPVGIFKLPVVFYMSITAAVVEEVVYKGIPLMLFSKYSKYKYFNLLFVVITASLFSLAHWENGIPDIVSALAFGVFSAIVYLRIRNLLPIIFAHFVGDFVTFW